MCKYVDELKECGFKKKCIKDIANRYGFKESDIKRYFLSLFFKDISDKIDLSNLAKQNIDIIEKSLDDALWLHRILKDNRLIIRVINPTSVKLLNKIKQKDSNGIEILIDYSFSNNEMVIKEDVDSFKIGLIMLYNSLLEERKMKKLLYSLKIPIFSFSSSPVENLKKSALILTKNPDLEHISSTLFDISIQLQLDLVLYDNDPENENKSEVIEHYRNLASIFSRMSVSLIPTWGFP